MLGIQVSVVRLWKGLPTTKVLFQATFSPLWKPTLCWFLSIAVVVFIHPHGSNISCHILNAYVLTLINIILAYSCFLNERPQTIEMDAWGEKNKKRKAHEQSAWHWKKMFIYGILYPTCTQALFIIINSPMLLYMDFLIAFM